MSLTLCRYKTKLLFARNDEFDSEIWHIKVWTAHNHDFRSASDSGGYRMDSRVREILEDLVSHGSSGKQLLLLLKSKVEAMLREQEVSNL